MPPQSVMPAVAGIQAETEAGPVVDGGRRWLGKCHARKAERYTGDRKESDHLLVSLVTTVAPAVMTLLLDYCAAMVTFWSQEFAKESCAGCA